MNHGAKLSEKQGFTYWFSFEFSYIVCLLLFFYLFNTDDHIDRVYKELKQVCFILIIMYHYVFSLFVLMQSWL